MANEGRFSYLFIPIAIPAVHAQKHTVHAKTIEKEKMKWYKEERS